MCRVRYVDVAVCIVLLCCAQRALAQSRAAGSTITLAAVGDVLLHDAVQQSAADHRDGFGNTGHNYLFARVRPLLMSADLKLANLETPIAPNHSHGTREYVFNASPDAARALTWAGVDVVSLANNHAYDQGVKGLVATLAHVRAAGLTTVGAGKSFRKARKVRYIPVGDYTVALVAYAQFINTNLNSRKKRKPHVNVLERSDTLKTIRAARRKADLVIVSVHWGDEYRKTPGALERVLGADMCAAGADVVFGHHPHVLQPVEEWIVKDANENPIRTCLIAFSLGNFISNQSRKWGYDDEHGRDTRESVIAFATFGTEPPRRGLRLKDWSVAPVWTVNNWPDRAAGQTEVTDIYVAPLAEAAKTGAGKRPQAPKTGKIFDIFPREHIWWEERHTIQMHN